MGRVPIFPGGRSYEAGMVTKSEGNDSPGVETFSVRSFGNATSHGPSEKEDGEMFPKIQSDPAGSFQGLLGKTWAESRRAGGVTNEPLPQHSIGENRPRLRESIFRHTSGLTLCLGQWKVRGCRTSVLL